MNFIPYRNRLKKIRLVKKLSGRTNITRWLHNISGVFLILFFIAIFVFKNNPSIWNVFIYLMAIFSAVAFFIETKKTIEYVLLEWWKTWLGKILYSGSALILALISTLVSKQIVHDITGVNPIYYPDFVSLLSILITILLVLFLIQFVVGFLGIVYLLKSYGLMLVSMFFTPITSKANSFLVTFSRILSGKKEKYPKIALGWYPTSMFIGSVSILFVLSYPMKLIANESEAVDTILTKSLVFLEYKVKTKCIDLSGDLKIAYLNKSNISIAKWDESKNNYYFEIDECNFK